MRHGHNYLQHLEGELLNARNRSRVLEDMSALAERSFEKLLPPDETALIVSNKSLCDPKIVEKREAFRNAHIKHSHALNRQAEIENEYFEFPEDFH